MQAELPKTINEALKILAYNDYFWDNGPKTPNSKINAHPKDNQTVRSLAEAQYAWTEKQAKLALVILKRYLTKFQAHNMDIKELLNNPKYDAPFRVINFLKSIEKFTDTDEVEKIEIKFPYDKKLISLIRTLKDKKGLPTGYSSYDGDQKKWIFLQTDVTTYYLTLLAVRYNFKFVDTSLIDDFEKIRAEKKNYKSTTANLLNDKIVLANAPDTLVEHWNNDIASKTVLQQVDVLKNFGINTKGIDVDAISEVGKKLAHSNNQKLWIDAKVYGKDQLINGLDELDCFPLLMPVSGDIQTREDALEWMEWLQCFERHGISTTKNLSFGFEIKEPRREMIAEDEFQDWFDISQLSKQFKYIDQNTKVIFVRNRIPRTLIKSKIKPKASLTAIGGGYYVSGTDNLKRLLDNLPKKLYYNDHQPSNYDWLDKVIVKL